MTTLEISNLMGPKPRSTFTLRAVTVGTLSGSATIEHRSKKLGNKTDFALLNALRRWATAVLVGAQTVRSENYFGVRKGPNGDDPAPMIVPTRKLDFDTTTQFFTDFYTPPIFLVPQSNLEESTVQGRIPSITSTGAEVVSSGYGTIKECLNILRDRGFKRVLCEGGPGMIGQLVDIDAIDQMYLTLDPHLSTGVETPMATFQGEHSHRRMQLENVAADHDGTVFLRYSRAR
ncbi:dihydrofolate reductase family protein [Corynebacterium tuberculostearicum]|nr:dihydrofolate reductase family protein [Corynebacterium tuberculostearicum]